MVPADVAPAYAVYLSKSLALLPHGSIKLFIVRAVAGLPRAFLYVRKRNVGIYLQGTSSCRNVFPL